MEQPPPERDRLLQELEYFKSLNNKLKESGCQYSEENLRDIQAKIDLFYACVRLYTMNAKRGSSIVERTLLDQISTAFLNLNLRDKVISMIAQCNISGYACSKDILGVISTDSLTNRRYYYEKFKDFLKPSQIELSAWDDAYQECVDVDKQLMWACDLLNMIQENLDQFREYSGPGLPVPQEDMYTTKRIMKALNLNQDNINSFYSFFRPCILPLETIFNLVAPETTNTRQLVDAYVEDALKRGFLQPYEGNIADSLSTNVCLIKSTDVGEWYAPIFPIIQGSGCGKTRSVELSKKGHYVVFACFRPEESSGYPKATQAVQKLMDEIKKCKSERDCINLLGEFFYRMILALAYFYRDNKVDMTPEQFFEMQFKETLVISKNERLTDEEINTARSFLKNLASRSFKKLPDGTFGKELAPIVFAIDEASVLASLQEAVKPLVQWKRFMKSIKEFAVGIYTDTFSDIGAIFPSIRFDTSKRARNGQLIFPPFISFMNDVYSDINVLKVYRLFGTGQDVDQLYLLGRPMWKTIENTSSALLLAIDKLAGPSIKSMAIAVATLRTSITLKATRHASETVSTHMATLIAFSPDREILTSLYLPEPILQHAATVLYLQYTKDVIEALDYLLNEVQVETGLVGEHIAEIVLLNAADKVRNIPEGLLNTDRNQLPIPLSLAFTVENFVYKFLGPASASVLSLMPDILRSGKMNIHKFCNMICRRENIRNINSDTIMRALVYQTGISFRGQFPCIDIVIPVLLENQKTTLLLFQIKNTKTAENLHKAIKNLTIPKRGGNDFHILANKLNLDLPRLDEINEGLINRQSSIGPNTFNSNRSPTFIFYLLLNQGMTSDAVLKQLGRLNLSASTEKSPSGIQIGQSATDVGISENVATISPVLDSSNVNTVDFSDEGPDDDGERDQKEDESIIENLSILGQIPSLRRYLDMKRDIALEGAKRIENILDGREAPKRGKVENEEDLIKLNKQIKDYLKLAEKYDLPVVPNGCIVSWDHLVQSFEASTATALSEILSRNAADAIESAIMQQCNGDSYYRANSRVNEIAKKLTLIAPDSPKVPDLANEKNQLATMIKKVVEHHKRTFIPDSSANVHL